MAEDPLPTDNVSSCRSSDKFLGIASLEGVELGLHGSTPIGNLEGACPRHWNGQDGCHRCTKDDNGYKIAADTKPDGGRGFMSEFAPAGTGAVQL